jgi:hypothetical protein
MRFRHKNINGLADPPQMVGLVYLLCGTPLETLLSHTPLANHYMMLIFWDPCQAIELCSDDHGSVLKAFHEDQLSRIASIGISHLDPYSDTSCRECV